MSEIFSTNSLHFADKKILETLGWSIPRRTGQNQVCVSGDMFERDGIREDPQIDENVWEIEPDQESEKSEAEPSPLYPH